MTILKHIKPIKHTAIVIAFLITSLWLLKSFEDSKVMPLWITKLISPIPESVLEPLLSFWMFVVSILGIEMTIRVRENKKYAEDISELQSSSSPIQYIISPNSLVKVNNTRAHGTPNENFRIGREKLLKELLTGFVTEYNTQILYGEDGMGKTRVAIEYAYMYEKEGVYSNLIWWLRANNKTVLEEDFLLLSRALSLDISSGSKQEKINSIFSWFKENSYWLLIFDDASDEETIKDFLPLNGTGNILITTTNPDWNAGHLIKPNLLKIEPLNPHDAKKFLIKRTGNRLSEEEATKLALDLEGYPLLLDLAGAHLSSGINEKKGLDFFKLISSEVDVEKKFISIVNKLFEDIQKVLKEQGTVNSSIGFIYTVWVLGWFEPQMIPKYIFNILIKNATIDESNIDSNKFWDRLALLVFSLLSKRSLITSLKILDILKKRSFITIDSKGEFININTRIQPFLPQIAVEYKEKGGKRRYSKLTLFNLNNFVDKLAQEFWFNEKKPNTIEKCELLTPHVISIIHKMSDFDLKLVGLFKLAKKLSEFLIYKEDYEEAQRYANYAYELEKHIKGKASYDTLKQNMLPLFITGKFDSLSKIIDESKASKEYNLIYEKILYGVEALVQEKIQDAFNYFEDVIELSKIPQNKDFETPILYAYTGLAATIFDNSKSDYYFNIAEEMITDKRTEDYAQLLFFKATALKSKHNEETGNLTLDQAMEFYEEAYSIVKEIKGEDNLLAIGIIIDKGMTCLTDSWYEHELVACCEIIERNMGFILKSVGAHHFFLGEYKIMKGQLFLWNDEREDAKKYFKEALEIHEKFFFASRVEQIKDVLERLESND